MFQQHRITAVHLTVGNPRVYSLDPIDELLTVLSAHHPRSRTHVEAVGVAAGKVARAMGLDDVDVEVAQIVGVLHDIGKIAVPASMLDEHINELSIAELREALAFAGNELLSNEEALRAFAPLVAEVFEHSDTDHEIVEIVRLCDAFDAMSRWQPYRSGVPSDLALTVLKEDGRHRDDHIDALAAIQTNAEKEICLS